MSKLNKDVLKRTAGLLSEIDTVISETTNMDQVDRLLQSACTPRGTHRLTDAGAEIVDSLFNAWLESPALSDFGDFVADHQDYEGSYEGPELVEVTWRCDCAMIDVEDTTFKHVQRYRMPECSFYAPHKEYPIDVPDRVMNHSQATQSCGVDGCDCEILFEDHSFPWEYPVDCKCDVCDVD